MKNKNIHAFATNISDILRSTSILKQEAYLRNNLVNFISHSKDSIKKDKKIPEIFEAIKNAGIKKEFFITIIKDLLVSSESKSENIHIYEVIDYLINKENVNLFSKEGVLFSEFNPYIHNALFLNSLSMSKNNFSLQDIEIKNPLSGLFLTHNKNAHEKMTMANVLIKRFPEIDEPDLVIDIIINENVASGIEWVVNSPYFNYLNREKILKLYLVNAYFYGINNENSLKMENHHKFYEAVNNLVSISKNNNEQCYPIEYFLAHFKTFFDIKFAESESAAENFRNTLFKLIKLTKDPGFFFNFSDKKFIGFNLLGKKNLDSDGFATFDSITKLKYLCNKNNSSSKILFKLEDINAFDLAYCAEHLEILYDFMPECLEESLSRKKNSSYMFILTNLLAGKKYNRAFKDDTLKVLEKIFKSNKELDYNEKIFFNDINSEVSMVELFYQDKDLVQLIRDINPETTKKYPVFIHNFCLENNYKRISEYTHKSINYKPNQISFNKTYPLENLLSCAFEVRGNKKDSFIKTVKLLLDKGENPLIQKNSGVNIYENFCILIQEKANLGPNYSFEWLKRHNVLDIVNLLNNNIRKNYDNEHLLGHSFYDIMIKCFINDKNKETLSCIEQYLFNKNDKILFLCRLLHEKNEKYFSLATQSKVEEIRNLIELNKDTLFEDLEMITNNTSLMNSNLTENKSAYYRQIMIPLSIEIQKLILLKKINTVGSNNKIINHRL